MMYHKKQHRNSKVRSRPHSLPTCHHLTRIDLQRLLDRDVAEIVKKVSSEIKQFQVTLEDSDICIKHLRLVLELLLKVSSGISSGGDVHFDSIMILGEVFNDRCFTFQSQLKIYVAKIMEQSHVDKDISLLCDLFETLLSRLPETCWSVLPLDELSQTIHFHLKRNNLSDGRNKLAKLRGLLEMREAIKDQQQVRSISASRSTIARLKTWDNTEYRNISVLPQWDEISTPKPPYKLRPNIVDGEYEDWMHYYDVHFRLLREDFMSPLRKGIKDYHDGKVGRNLSNLNLYNGVTITREVFTHAGLCHEINFDVGHKKYNWVHSKKLIFGSLLCLSPDKFSHKVFFATVSNRNDDELRCGNIEVMFQAGTEMITYKDLRKTFVMVESVAYFEASRHILRSLQTAEDSTMPFTKYLLKNDSKNVNAPKYLHLSPPRTTYDMSLIIKEKVLLRPKLAFKFSHIDIRESRQWPPLEDTELDESQLTALKMSLTQEIAIIQGPPGTGKTYIGLKIVQALLKNVSVWNSPGVDSLLRSPILVMCFTNHALDQFLEGIMDLNKDEKLNLIRIGGRSKNENIEKCNLSNVKRNLRNVPKQEYELMKRLSDEVRNVGIVCKTKLRNYKDPVLDFVSFHYIKPVISEYHIRSLQDPAESEEEQQLALELWLGLYVKRIYEEDGPVEFTEDSFDEVATSSEDDDDGEYDTANSEFDDESEDGADNLEDGTIDILGEGSREEEARLIEGMEDRYKELTFDKLHVVKEKKSKKRRNIMHIVKIEKYHDHKKFMKFKMRNVNNELDPEEIEDLHQLDLDERWEVYKYWHSKYRSHLLKDLEEECQRYNRACEDANTAKHNNDRYTLETAHVIGMTTTGAAKYQHVLHLLKPRIVIVEEAAEVLESHIVSALNAGTQHLILIGDHKQLRPKPNEYDLAVKFKLDISLFERLVKNNFPHATLQNQHRMRPEIAELVHPHIYDTLHNHVSVQNYPKVRGVSSDMFLISHREIEQPSSDQSHSNKHEAQYLTALCKYLLLQSYKPSQITILVPYTGQLLLVKNSMPKSEFEGVRISTVDNFQGEENDIILLSLVRSNNEDSIGFLREENRVCVALSRARHGFYCIGNFDMLRRNSSIWQTIVSDMESKGRVGDGLKIYCTNHPQNDYIAKSHLDFSEKSPNGGCNLECGVRLSCGHTCTQKCHFSDPKHMKVQCRKPCGQTCPQGHKCNKLCYKKCLCMVWLEKELLKCDHTKKMYCHEDPKDVLCMAEVEKGMPGCEHTHTMYCHEVPKTCLSVVRKIMPRCAHSQEMYCSQDPGKVFCQFVVEKNLPECGHKQNVPCHQNPMGIKCQTMVAKLLQGCGHSKDMPCHQNPMGIKCQTMVAKLLQGCGHSKDMPCHCHPIYESCISMCKNLCPNGHPCELKCHHTRVCKPCQAKVMVTFPNCNHEQLALCHQDASKIKCLARCEKSCPEQRHPCPLKCNQRCESCTVMIDVTLKCGHLALSQCSKKDQLVCTKMVDVTLSCGHSTSTRCSKDVNSIICQTMVDVTLKCGHSTSTRCSKDVNSIICQTMVEVTLKCGHSTSKMCMEDLNSIECMELCNRVLKCGHGKKLLCHKDPGSVTCIKPCIKPLGCGHTRKVACFEEVSSSNCVELCENKFPCGHTLMSACNSDPSSIICTFPCTKKLECGHNCHAICGTKCACTEMVQVTLPSCNHQAQVLCTRAKNLDNFVCVHPCDRKLPCKHKCRNICRELCTTSCRELVTFMCSQGCHKQSLQCCEKSTRGHCNKGCEKMLKCGHPCKMMCFEQCTSKCMYVVIKKYPCGHEHRIPCYKPMEEMPCDLICRFPLACGHYCRGKCSDCLASRIHRPCSSTVSVKHFCGEKTRMSCLGLRNKHSRSLHKSQVIECKHRKIPWKCSTPLLDCKEPCGWVCAPQCPHPKKCSKSCSEQCDRDPCEEKCNKKLRCGHLCVGLCGEPCITVCPLCDSEAFSSQHKQSSKFLINEHYVQLPCGHIFTVKAMDKHVDRAPDSDVCPLQCPVCTFPLSCSFRYGNLMKRSLNHVEAAGKMVKVTHRGKKIDLLQLYSDANKRISKSQLSERGTPELVRSLSILMNDLFDTKYQPSNEEEFLLFLIGKVFDFVSRSSQPRKVCAAIEVLSSWIGRNFKGVKLSYQVINDLLSEYYRLWLLVHMFSLANLADIKEQFSFLDKFNVNNNLRITRRDFIYHSRILDQKSLTMPSRPNFKPTDEVLAEVESFQPVIRNGLWRKCLKGHHYCVPVSEPQCLKVQCSECIGTYSGSMEILILKEYKPLDISHQRDCAIKMASAQETAHAQGRDFRRKKQIKIKRKPNKKRRK